MEFSTLHSFFKKTCQRVEGKLSQNMQLQDLGENVS